MAVADLNGDHKLDLAVADQQANDVSVLLGNGDGQPDVVTASYSSNGAGHGSAVSILLNNTSH